MKRSIIASFFALGVTSLVSQVVVIRELAMSFYANELFIGWVLFAWLFWTGTGSILEKIFPKVFEEIPKRLWLCPLFLALLFPVMITLIRSGKWILGVPAGTFPEILPAFIYSFAALAPFCLVLGLQFVRTVKYQTSQQPTTESERVTGRAYFCEVLGFLAGGILFSLALVFLKGFHVAALLGFLNLGVAWSLLPPGRKAGKFLVIAGMLLMAGLFLSSAALQHRTEQMRFPSENLVASENTIHGNIAVTRAGGQANFYQNGILLGTGEEKLASENLVHFPMLMHPAPESVLLIGTGFNGVLREILKHAPKKVESVELDPREVALAREHIPEPLQRTLEDPRIHLWHGDSRDFLNQNSDRFDLVILNVPDPSTVLTNRCYSEEFFRKIKERHLKPGGVVALRLTFAANFVSPELEALAASIYKTFQSVFPYVAALPEDTLFLIGSGAPLQKDPVLLTERFESRGLKNDFVTPAYLKYRLTNDRVGKVTALFEQNQRVSLNEDLRPSGYFYQSVYWLSSFCLPLAQAFAFLDRVPFWAAGFFLIILFGMPYLFKRDGPQRSLFLAAMAIGTGGFSLMSAEILVIYVFQVVSGDLYYRIAWILAAFMAGMGIGAWYASSHTPKKISNYLGFLHLALAGGCLFFAVLSRELMRPEMQGMGLGLFLFFATAVGVCLGLEFPNALRLYNKGGNKNAAGVIYATDLFGSGLGALLTAGFLVPIWGVLPTLLLLGALNLFLSFFLFTFKQPGGESS